MKHGVGDTYIELEGFAHQRTEMIERLEPTWFDYHAESRRVTSTDRSRTEEIVSTSDTIDFKRSIIPLRKALN